MDQKSTEIILYGQNSLQGVVAVEHSGRFCRVFIRDSQGVTIHDYPFEPFLLVDNPESLKNCPLLFDILQLSGENILKFLLTFQTWQDCCCSKDFLDKASAVPGTGFHFICDPVQQFLVRTGITFFKGLDCSEIRVMAVEVKRLGDKRTSGSDNGYSITIACNNGLEDCLVSKTLCDQSPFEQLAAVIAREDPDIILTDDITHLSLSESPERSTVDIRRLRWGRNGASPVFTGFKGDPGGDWPVCSIYGRSVIEMKALPRLDGLKSFMPLATCNTPRSASALLKEYLIQAPLYYKQASIFPYSFQSMLLRTPQARANSLILREYIRTARSVPQAAKASTKKASSSMEPFSRGLFSPVACCDISLIHSSIMLLYRIKPESDHAGIILPFMSVLCRMLSEQKGSSSEIRNKALASLVRSIPAMLAVSQLNFYDLQASEELLRLGKVIIRDMTAWLIERGTEPVESGVDEIYFVPSEGTDGAEDIAALKGLLSAVLPAKTGIRLSCCYRSMLLYRHGNFALLDRNGNIYLKGSLLDSKLFEPYLKEFLFELLQMLLEGRSAELRELQARYLKRLRSNDFDITWIARTETLTESLDEYFRQVASGRRHRNAVYEVASRTKGGSRSGEKISYYVTGGTPDVTLYDHAKGIDEFSPDCHDINTSWYSERLRAVFERATSFAPEQPALF